MGALKRTSTQAQHTEITSAATPRSLFEHFLAIRQVDIDRDLAAPLDTRERLSAWQQTRVQCQDGLHQLEAQGLHSILLTTYKLQQEGQVALDDYLFLAAAAANMVASDFIEMALDHPPLKRLGDLLNCFKAREGRANELGWLNGDGPADYEKASGEYSKVVVSLLEAVHTTVFTRYRLTSVLELYESDFIRYELLRSKGLERHRKPLPPSAPVGSQVSETSATTRTFIEQASPVQSRARKIAGHGEDAI
jgi:hypothetical protein